MAFKFETLDVWRRSEVVSLLIMTGRRGCLDERTYGEHYREANEIAAILTALARK